MKLEMSTSDRDLSQLLELAGARPPLPEERAGRIREAVLPAWRREARQFRRRRLRAAVALALAAGFVAAAGLVLWTRAAPATHAEIAVAMRFSGSAPQVERGDGSVIELVEGSVVVAGDRIRTGSGRTALELAGGSSLRLDAETEVFLIDPGELRLDRGALYVDSGLEGSPAEGVAVRTALGVVQEIGTQFEVRIEGNELRVRVREGEVRFGGRRAVVSATAADELLVLNDGAVRRGHVPAYGSEWEWALSIAPEYELDGRTVGDFLRWASRETGWEIRYSDPRLAESVDSISIRGPRATVSPRDALPLVLAASELTYRIDDGVLTLSNHETPGGEE